MSIAIAEILKDLRQQHGWTLREVADRASVSHSYLSQVESGKIQQPSPRVLRRIAAVYSADYHALMVSAGYLPVDLARPGVPFRGQERLTREQRHLIQRVIDALLESKEAE